MPHTSGKFSDPTVPRASDKFRSPGHPTRTRSADSQLTRSPGHSAARVSRLNTDRATRAGIMPAATSAKMRSARLFAKFMNIHSKALVRQAVAIMLVFVTSLSPVQWSQTTAFADAADGIDDCSDLDTRPLPRPGGAAAPDFWSQFSSPLPPTAVWNPPGPKRVGIQAGHWRVEEAPEELRQLGPGTSGGGKAEWEVNLDVAERTATMLRAEGVEVDVLPVYLPERYRAHAFISLHADGDVSGALNGFKIARPVFSAIPETDERLVATMNDAYERVTGIPRDDAHISRRMTGYYAFNTRRYCHAIARGVPAAIVEMGFLTNAGDRLMLIGNPDVLARGITDGILRFLDTP